VYLQALHVMMPDLGRDFTTFLQTMSDEFKGTYGVEVIPTYVPSSQIVSEIRFELEHNLTNSHDGYA
jgi:hypothetical protein